MSALLTGPSLIPPTLPLLDASDPVRAAALLAAVAVVGMLGWLTFQERRRTMARAVVARHTFATPMRRRHDHGRVGASAA